MKVTLTVITSGGTKHTAIGEAESPADAIDTALKDQEWLNFTGKYGVTRVQVSQIAEIEAEVTMPADRAAYAPSGKTAEEAQKEADARFMPQGVKTRRGL
jgi:hypothetical protein